MILLDTDTVTLLFSQHARVVEHYQRATDVVGTTVISRIETLLGRFAYVLKAEDGARLMLAARLLRQTEKNLETLSIVDVGDHAAVEFDRLRNNAKLKKIGRADLLIASIALAQKATLVTRNLKHFRQVPGLRVENWAD